MKPRDFRRILAGILHRAHTANATERLLDGYRDQVLAEHAPQHGVLAEVAAERGRQDKTFGEQNHPDGTNHLNINWANHSRNLTQSAALEERLTWAHVLQEEFTEALAEVEPLPLRAELVQVAAVAVAWIEAIDRRPIQL